MSEDAEQGAPVPSTYQELAARFPASAHKTRKQGGRDLTYVDGEMVVSRLNEALGFDGWSFEVKSVTVLEDEVWAQGRLTVYVGDRTVIREQTGGQIINRTRGIPPIPARDAVPAEDDRPAQPAVPAQPAKKGDVIELANDIKGAVTDCLKKCATLVGVGLYLYDPEERREVENEMAAAKRGGNRPPSPAPAPITPRVDAAAKLTGAAETTGQRWARLVAAAEIAKLPTLGTIRAIDPKAVGEAQLARHCERLAERLAEARKGAA